MNKVKFRIPETANVIIRWFRPGKGFTDTLIPRPANNEMLRLTMLQNHHVGHSEIRCVKAVNETDLTTAVNRNFGRRQRATAG
jgi:hypothetical protein